MTKLSSSNTPASAPATFLALKLQTLEPVPASGNTRVELRRGVTAITVLGISLCALAMRFSASHKQAEQAALDETLAARTSRGPAALDVAPA